MDNHPGGQYVIHQPQPTIYPPNFGMPMRSCPLIGFGITLIIFSLASAGLAYWAVSFSVKQELAYANLACAAFFLLTASFAVHGGQDVGNRHCSIVTSMVLGILGVITAVVGIITNMVAIAWYNENCRLCHLELDTSNMEITCSTTCFAAYLPVHVGLIVITVLMAIFGLILSCSACCNVCSCCCCYAEPGNRMVITQPSVTAFIQQPNVPYRPLNDLPPNNPPPEYNFDSFK